LVPNRAEAAVLVAAETPEGMVSELLQHYPMVALKLGAHGCCVGSRDEGVCIVQGTPALPLDSTGAGDAFAAALVCGLLSGKGLAESANVANRLAARVVGVVGARPRLLSQGQM
jgi:sugar/nucleoside kinase (ribokinase family)